MASRSKAARKPRIRRKNLNIDQTKLDRAAEQRAAHLVFR